MSRSNLSRADAVQLLDAASESSDEEHKAFVNEVTERLAAAIKESPTPQALKLADSNDKGQAPEFVLDPWLPRGEVTLLGGHGGAGKSVLALSIAAHCANGRAWAGAHPAVTKSVFVSLEDPSALVLHRLDRIITACSLDAETVRSNLSIYSIEDGDPTLAVERTVRGVRELYQTELLTHVSEVTLGAGLLVIDNASDAFAGDENSRRQVRSFLRMLAEIARQDACAVLLLAHIDKNASRGLGGAENYSGSTQWHNSVRSRLALIPDGDRIELRHEKANHSAKAEPVPLAWHEAIPVPSVGSEVKRRESEETDEDQVLAAIESAIKTKHLVPAAKFGPRTTWSLLQDYPEVKDLVDSQDGRRRFRAAITRLLIDGHIEKVTYKNDQRHAREKLELTQKGKNRVSQSVEKGASIIPPYPPIGTDAPMEVAPVQYSGTDAELTQNQRTDAVCPSCQGEGCRWCKSTNGESKP